MKHLSSDGNPLVMRVNHLWLFHLWVCECRHELLKLPDDIEGPASPHIFKMAHGSDSGSDREKHNQKWNLTTRNPNRCSLQASNETATFMATSIIQFALMECQAGEAQCAWMGMLFTLMWRWWGSSPQQNWGGANGGHDLNCDVHIQGRMCVTCEGKWVE